jgi:uncharacterized protein YjiS (DUF1127 family)
MQQAVRPTGLPAKPLFTSFLPSVLAALATWRSRSRTRQQLAALDALALADLGLSGVQQRAETGKWFWQA